MDFNKKKFKELILYIADQSENDPKFGAVKLNKILFYADFLAHRELGKSITAAEYQHLNEGPAPKQFLPILEEMLSSGDAHIDRTEYFSFCQNRLVADRPAALDTFTKTEKRLIDAVIEYLRSYNATEVSDLSHREFAWQLTEDGETIPYSAAAFLLRSPLTMEQTELGKEIAQRHGLA